MRRGRERQFLLDKRSVLYFSRRCSLGSAPSTEVLARDLSMAVLHRTANSKGESPVCLGAFTDYTYNERRLIFCDWGANLLTQLEFLLMGESLEALSA